MVIVSWRAHWFDGFCSTPRAVRVLIEGAVLRIQPDTDDESASRVLAEVPLRGLAVSERFLAAPRMLDLPEGGSLQVEDDADGSFDTLLRQVGYRPDLVYQLIDHWRNVLVCLTLLIGVIVWMDRQGAGLFASFAVPFVPSSVDARIGHKALALADAQWLTASSVPSDRRSELQERFTHLVHEQYPNLAWQLEFRGTSEGKDSFNAFALPGGTIVLLDGLVEAMDDEEIIAVLGHELGHVVHRDVMQGIVRQMGLLGVAGVVWGQMSTFAASVAAGVQGLHFARDVETDADAFAVRFLRRAGIPVRRLADAFAVMQRQEKTTGVVPTFLSDHPSTAERLRAAEAARNRPVSGSLPTGKDWDSAELIDWRLRLRAAVSAEDWSDAAHSVIRIAQKWPDSVSDLEPRELYRTVAKAPHLDDTRYELLKALFDAKFKRPGTDSYWWRDLALMQIERGDRDGALASLSALTNPYAMIGVLADNRFKDIRDSLPQPLDVSGAARRVVETDYKRVADNPSKLASVNGLASDLLAGLRAAEALKVLDSVIEKAGTPDGRKSYKDFNEQYVWILDTRSRALFMLGRWDDAVTQMQAASRLKEDGSPNTSQVINLGELYNRLQRPGDARAALKEVGAMSPYGEMERADVELSAALQLEDSAESTRLLDYMREHQDDAIGSYEDALIMANRLDDAAKLLISRLEDPEKRIQALMAVQHYDQSGPPASLPRAQELARRWTELTSRADVRAAVARVGSVGTYALRDPGND